MENLAVVEKKKHHIEWDMHITIKDGYKHFMLKEIMEQPKIVVDCLAGRLIENTVYLPELDNFPVPKRLHIVACGTSYHAGMWGRQLIEKMTGISVHLDIASEFRYRDPILHSDEMVLVISQSGETADTVAALRLAKEKGCKVIGLCNVVGASIARESDIVIYTQAGPEISVASTKAMCSQMVLLVLLAVYYRQRTKYAKNDQELLNALKIFPEQLAEQLQSMKEKAAELAKQFSSARSFFYLGRGQSYALALEGALKLKELSYIHAEGYALGEMKHGPIALIDNLFPSLVLALNDEFYSKVKSNIQEILARNGVVIALTQGNWAELLELGVKEIWELPCSHPVITGFFALSALQLFSYFMADELGKDIDQPRNLAKSVTVE